MASVRFRHGGVAYTREQEPPRFADYWWSIVEQDDFLLDLFDVQYVLAARQVPGTRSTFAERQSGREYIDIVPDREAIARYGLSVRAVHDIVEAAIGGMPVSTIIDGRGIRDMEQAATDNHLRRLRFDRDEMTQQQLAGERYTKAYISALETGIARPSMVALSYLSERLVESWDEIETPAGGKIRITPEGRIASGDPGEELLPVGAITEVWALR